MSKWKCEICNSSFENFDARGFDNKIYCPLCYYKKLYKDTELEREKLTNIINELEKRLEVAIEDNKKEYSLKSQMAVFVLRDTLELIEELKGVDKE